jgi:hypothetical protein
MSFKEESAEDLTQMELTKLELSSHQAARSFTLPDIFPPCESVAA